MAFPEKNSAVPSGGGMRSNHLELLNHRQTLRAGHLLTGCRGGPSGYSSWKMYTSWICEMGYRQGNLLSWAVCRGVISPARTDTRSAPLMSGWQRRQPAGGHRRLKRLPKSGPRGRTDAGRARRDLARSLLVAALFQDVWAFHPRLCVPQ